MVGCCVFQDAEHNEAETGVNILGEQTFGVNNSIISIATTVFASGDTPDETRDEKEETTFSHSLPVFSADPASYAGRRMTAQNINLIHLVVFSLPTTSGTLRLTVDSATNRSFMVIFQTAVWLKDSGFRTAVGMIDCTV